MRPAVESLGIGEVRGMVSRLAASLGLPAGTWLALKALIGAGLKTVSGIMTLSSLLALPLLLRRPPLTLGSRQDDAVEEVIG